MEDLAQKRFLMFGFLMSGVNHLESCLDKKRLDVGKQREKMISSGQIKKNVATQKLQK